MYIYFEKLYPLQLFKCMMKNFRCQLKIFKTTNLQFFLFCPLYHNYLFLKFSLILRMQVIEDTDHVF